MAALDIDARREGHKAMEKTITAGARMRRRLRAGRPARLQSDSLTPLQAVNRLVTEADKARNLMREEGLDPDDIRCALVFCAPEIPGLENAVRYEWLPAPGETSGYFTMLDELARSTRLEILGILWHQKDREAEVKGEEWMFLWVTQFMGGPKAEQGLLTAREDARRGNRDGYTKDPKKEDGNGQV